MYQEYQNWTNKLLILVWLVMMCLDDRFFQLRGNKIPWVGQDIQESILKKKKKKKFRSTYSEFLLKANKHNTIIFSLNINQN